MTKLVLYKKSNNQIFFWMSKNSLNYSFSQTLPQFAEANFFKHHDSFDVAVGNLGKNATLMELQNEQKCPKEFLENWHTFRGATQILTQGDCKRFLQLAVQFIAAGGVEDNLSAGEVGAEMLKNWEGK
jgi:hypothetical protein